MTDIFDCIMDGKSLDITKENISAMKQLFPEIVTDGKVDFEKLRLILGDEVETSDERYNFTWHGKNQAIRLSQTPSMGTLRPCKEDSVNWDTTKNLYIEGDNLEVLKLLQRSYFGRIKMIYIDPPYNTGKDFIYSDNFKDNISNYKIITNQIDNDGCILSTNSESDGRFHTNWLNMMYPRLKLARNLLADNGAIFISIDDNEVCNLRKICDEIFGESNFVAQFVVQLNPRGRNLSQFVANTHEYVLAYIKDHNSVDSIIGVEKEGSMIEEYNHSDEKGPYRLIGLRNRNQSFNPQTRPNLYYPIYICPSDGTVSVKRDSVFSIEVWPDAPDGTKTCWTWMKSKVEANSNLIVAEKQSNGWRVFRKDYLNDDEGNCATTLAKSLWTDGAINNDYGKKAIRDLFGKNVMSFPKSPELIKKLIQIGCKEGIVLDFFSGSATTVESLFQMNSEDGGTRNFIMVQIPEQCPPESEAYSLNLNTICDLGKERIRKAGLKYNTGQTTLDESNTVGDVGFRVFSLDDSNLKKWSVGLDLRNSLLSFENSLISDSNRNDMDIVFEILLKLGLDLNSNVEERQNYYSVENGTLMICLKDIASVDIAQAMIDEFKEKEPLVWKVVFKDNGFASDDVKANTRETLKMAGLQDGSFITL